MILTNLQTTVLKNVITLVQRGDVFAVADVMAFCEIESSFNPFAYRYEQKLSEASYGLVQILVSTARDRGFKGDEKELYGIEINLTYGVAQLRWLTRYIADHPSDKLPRDLDNRFYLPAAYNAGVGNLLHGFVPSGYIAKWALSYAKWSRLDLAAYA